MATYTRDELWTPRSGNAAGLSRRGFLGATALVGAGVALAACTPGPSSVSASGFPTALPAGSPKRGGTLTLGTIGAGSAEVLNPGTASTGADFARLYSLYNLLFYPGTDITPLTPGLALSADSNSDATVWRLNLRSGVVWHDGKPFTADDVVYNFKALWSDPQANFSAAFLAGLVDFKNVRAVGPHAVEVPLLQAVAEFPSLLVFYNFGVVQAGATAQSIAARPIGTGPFKFESFTPGRQSVFVRNDDYWESGKPYVDKLVINSSFTDPTSVTNALVGGQVDLVPGVDPNAARRQLSAKKFQVLQSRTAAQQGVIGMRVDSGPFADVRVRQAFRYAVDRQALINGTLSGFGTPGNDLIAPATPYYAADLTREHDPDKARALFQAAGVLGNTFTLETAPYGGVFDGAATLFAQQVSAAGVKVAVHVGSAETYFTPAGGAYTGYFRQNLFQPVCSLTAGYRAYLTSGAPYPDTHWGGQKGGAAAEKLIARAVATVDKDAAARAWGDVQQQQFDEGGYIGWANMPYVDAAANNVRGLSASAGLNFNNYRLCDGWLE